MEGFYWDVKVLKYNCNQQFHCSGQLNSSVWGWGIVVCFADFVKNSFLLFKYLLIALFFIPLIIKACFVLQMMDLKS